MSTPKTDIETGIVSTPETSLETITGIKTVTVSTSETGIETGIVSTPETGTETGATPKTGVEIEQRVTKGTAHRFEASTEGDSNQPTTHTKEDKKKHQDDMLCKLGLNDYYPSRITLSSVLQIGKDSITDEPIQSLKKLPWRFIKRLMMVNVTTGISELMGDRDHNVQESNTINPLDLLTALFLCSDSFLQQEMMLKMSMCQFAVPLLLPNCSSNQCTLMLWAMRDTVKKFRPHSLTDSKGFVEDSIVSTPMPMVSFVRLGDCSLSKSQILNKVLSNPQQYHDFFTHRDMECGDIPRRISNGLVEIAWYLPCGKKNLDIFPEPVAVANLRGDITSFDKQFSFLCHISSAVFVIFDSSTDRECHLLKYHGAKLFLVENCSEKTQNNNDAQKNLASALKLKQHQIILKNKRINEANFVKKLHSTMKDVIANHPQNMTLEGTSHTAHNLGIAVDEDCTKCQKAKRSAEEITFGIKDVVKYKEDQLPLQGKPCRDLAKIEKEECRLRKAGDQPIEAYKTNLQTEKQKLRQKQISYKITEAMQCFITAISNESKEERSYFLKWLRMNLDATARSKLSGLRDKYKLIFCNFSENKDIISALDEKISNSSLGVEHFMREMGQLYEASCFLPVNNESHEGFHRLPSLGADLLLDGIPLELVDGDASNIPIKWVTSVLTELHKKVMQKSRVRVVTVLGVQATGKSTLLNTMFGVQFAVSSGRCTRGAFMILIRVKDELIKELNCEFILVIDTEGLKCPELAQLKDSYEHDNELATLVVGLSDITVINIAMENSTEMKDVLQIVVHAFLRMKEVGKHPKCHFVHQNVADVSADDKNMRDRKVLLEQLNEVTVVASRMEKHNIDRKFTDIMEYDLKKNNWYIPGLWHGTPPMAPVNTGYSETVYEFKKSLIEVLKSYKDQKSCGHVLEFLEWVQSLWKAVKYENFIFSFQNSLVAEAYNNLCVEYGKWEWDFQKHMYQWLVNAETRISNATNQPLNLDEFLSSLINKASKELTSQEETTQKKLTKYYEINDGRANLVERYKATFERSISTVKMEIENSLTNKLTAAIDFQKGMKKVHEINLKHKAMLDEEVMKLLLKCRERNDDLSEEKLKEEFENMWEMTVATFNSKGLEEQNIVLNVNSQLRKKLERHAGFVNMVLNETTDLTTVGNAQFNVTDEHFSCAGLQGSVPDHVKGEAHTKSQSVIQHCKEFILEKQGCEADYHETYTRELLEMIEDKLRDFEELQTTAQFEVDLKLHICGFAAREFQKMHKDFIAANDPRKHLENSKLPYSCDFIDLYHKKDQCKQKAEKFTKRCLEPAVRDYVIKTLGMDIVDEMLTGAHSLKYSTRSAFQHSLLKELLEKKDFAKYVEYIHDYENFVKTWIFDCICEQFSKEGIFSELEVKRLKTVRKKIEAAIVKESNSKNGSKTILENVCSTLNSDIVIPTDDLGLQFIKDNENTNEFIEHLLYYVGTMKPPLSAQECDVKNILKTLTFQPQDELFKRVFGCGKQCPFCKVPCEAGGKDHSEHHASVHRPQGLATNRYVTHKKLNENVCTSDVYSERKFKNSDTKGELHPFKDYRKFYPEWYIAPDPSLTASDYWKYVLTTFNKEFAVEYKSQPADVPKEWTNITKQQALRSLKGI
ncbi:UNVERIFIED_CONTAM: hypothetical protein FKN15_031402 [Acipenser sinensis]